MITIEEFVQKFAEQFELTNPKIFSPETNFKQLEDWDSLASLSIIAMINADYNVELRGSDIRGVNTVQEVFNIVKSKLQ